jgi:5-formyltetrahydrofolate cyclo-ligase
MIDKPTLRADLRERRAAFARDCGPMQSAFIASLFVAEHAAPRLEGARIVSAFVSDGSEVDPMAILLRAIDIGIATALPRVTVRAEPMRFHLWMPGDDLVPGPLGLLQPREDAPEVSPDLILAPLLGFDRAMNRLGQGAGFYDRAFAALPDARRIGLAWSVQEVDAIPTDAWDMPLHGVATEKEWIDGPAARA